MKSFLAIVFASVYGLSMRFMYGFLTDFMSIMSIAFLVLTPVVIGFMTVRLSKCRNGATAFFKPWLTSLVILFITLAFNIEGAICWFMLFPLFAVMAGIGGSIAFSLSKNKPRKRDRDVLDDHDWEKPDKLKMSFLLLLPVLAGFIEGERGQIPVEMFIAREVVIDAPKKEVWKQLAGINDIAAGENRTSLSGILGFPSHLKTVSDTLALGGKRKAIYENGLYFDETITSYENEKLMVLKIKTDPLKIPPTVLDEHIVIGGKHVDILEDIYHLESLPDGTSRLTLSSRFYINTPFNWYAGIWANYLMSDILGGELELIKKRAEDRG